MFPYTHICFARDVLGKINNEIILGAIFPDTAISGFIDHKETHRGSAEVYRYFRRLGVFDDFSLGLITHAIDLKGLDYFCDEKYLNYEKGYAFEMARPLVDKVVKCCHLPEQMGWWKAHNFIEMATELWIYQNRTDCHGFLDKALDDLDLILGISHVLAPFYDIPAGKMAMSFPIYGEFVLMEKVTALELAKKYHQQTLKKHQIEIDIQGTADVIEQAVDIVERTLPEFMKFCERHTRSVIENLNPSI